MLRLYRDFTRATRGPRAARGAQAGGRVPGPPPLTAARAAGVADPRARSDLRAMVRAEFERFRGETDPTSIAMLLSSGRGRLRELSAAVAHAR